ncbi:MAG TPA: alpha/beta hydrolase [Terrimicrobiaceae bacterium]|nr:alpha/beta hydrolase [Terrimicrobiaceae bacterium]
MIKRGAIWLLVALATFLGVRVYDTQRGPPLRPWHTYVPKELSVSQLDKSDWADFLKAEEDVFARVRTQVTEKLDPEDRVPSNRYFAGSPLYPGHFSQDWNRSFVLEPDGTPIGAAVFLHGLTDSPYSLRHIAQRYRDLGYLSLGIRLPGHGTVPGGLIDAEWEEWLAATRLAVREARRRAGPSVPLHLVGYSNGAALALMYALEAIENRELARPDRLVLISPMIGVTAFARFAGVAGWPAIFPAFAKAAWLSILPEFNPFKYNSFPVDAARQTYLLTDALQRQISRHARNGRLSELPPVLTFQSVIDATVSTRAIISSFYSQLPKNGSELVLFDLNRNTKFGPLVRPELDTVVSQLLPKEPRKFRTSIVTNASPATGRVVERSTEAGQTTEQFREIGLTYPSNVYSLSHVALPFPTTDSLYGTDPDPGENFGVHLGAVAGRGERGTLIVSLDTLFRMSSNPFFPYLLERIEEGVGVDPSRDRAAPPPK